MTRRWLLLILPDPSWLIPPFCTILTEWCLPFRPYCYLGHSLEDTLPDFGCLPVISTSFDSGTVTLLTPNKRLKEQALQSSNRTGIVTMLTRARNSPLSYHMLIENLLTADSRRSGWQVSWRSYECIFLEARYHAFITLWVHFLGRTSRFMNAEWCNQYYLAICCRSDDCHCWWLTTWVQQRSKVFRFSSTLKVISESVPPSNLSISILVHIHIIVISGANWIDLIDTIE